MITKIELLSDRCSTIDQERIVQGMKSLTNKRERRWTIRGIGSLMISTARKVLFCRMHRIEHYGRTFDI